MEQERLNLQKKQLENEVIEPVRAAREAAQILENGLAEIEVLKQKSELWKIFGAKGKELMLIQMLPGIVDRVAEMTKEMKIDHLAVVDSGSSGHGGTGLQSVFNQIGSLTPALFETIKATTGLDLADTLASSKEEIPEKIAN